MATEPPLGSQSWGRYLPWMGVLLLGALLRMFRIGEQIIIDDEWHALNAVQDQGYGWIFSHFGHADHSIPLALLYEFFSHSIGLGEITMRLPSLLAGILTIILLPRLLQRWLKPREGVALAALIAISPFLVNYSRIARPYAMLALLAGAAIPLAWCWWQHKKPVHGIAWFFCAVFAAWLNPVTLAITMAPFLWFGVEAFRSADRSTSLLRLGSIFVAIDIVVSALLFAPFSNDWASLAVKSGVHQVSLETLQVALGLFSGSGSLLVSLAVLSLALFGWFELHKRDRAFALYLVLIAAASIIAVSLTGAEWISMGIVLARYLLGLLPVFLALVAIGLVVAGEKIALMLKLWDGSIPSTLAILLLFFAGPLPGSGAGPNQFMHHMAVQFDYDKDRNPIRAALEPIKPESFYQEIAELHPEGDALIAEAPWYLESNWNALSLYQAVHGQQVLVAFVSGTCAGRLYGELRQDITGLDFQNFAPLKSVLNGETGANYLVLRKSRPPTARKIEMDGQKCEQAVREVFGEPWRSTESALVFSLSGDSWPKANR